MSERYVVHNHLYRIDNTHTVRSGAISSARIEGLVYVDKRIKPWDKLPSGWACNNWKYLATHELTEKAAMLRLGFRPDLPRLAQTRIYLLCHSQVAIPAELRAVEADGGNTKEYNHHMDGLLAAIENEPANNPPPDPFLSPAITLDAKQRTFRLYPLGY